ncbi:MAG: BspA family leucine-rich repeat surface protein [Prevotella sp.]|nr:BspA family leucine-rich repeat surface protein [Prevotella sp.]
MKNILVTIVGLLMATNTFGQTTWTSLITNGDFEGDDLFSFSVKESRNGNTPELYSPVVIEDPLEAGNHCVEVYVRSYDESGEVDELQEYDTQFFISAPEEIPAGKMLRLTLRVRADGSTLMRTQIHADPGDYITYNPFGDIDVTTKWQTIVLDEIQIPPGSSWVSPSTGLGVRTVALDLTTNQDGAMFYFDDIVFEVMDGPTLDFSNAIELVTNGDMEGEDGSCFYKKDDNQNVIRATIEDGVGKNGSRGIMVQTVDNPTNSWDSQFWILLNKKLPAGTMYRVEFDYKASKSATVATEAHNNPTNYIDWGLLGSISFTTAWKHFEYEGTVTDSQSPANNPLWSIAFTLASNETSTKFYFDNISVVVPEASVLIDPNGSGTALVENGDMEGDNTNCFYKQEQNLDNEQIRHPFIEDGIGVDGSRGIMVQSDNEPPHAGITRFYIQMTKSLPVGTSYHVSFDYKASQQAKVSTEAHNMPGTTVYEGILGDLNFTTEWQHFDFESVITTEQSPQNNPFWTIAFNLAEEPTATTYYFDNIVIEELTQDVSVTATPTITQEDNTLTISCATENATIYYTMDGTEPTENSDQYTSPITLTQDCIVSAMAVTGGMLPSSIATYQAVVTISGPEPVVVNLISNGDMEGEDNGNFYTRYYPSEASPATISDGMGVNDSRGVKVEAKVKQEDVWDHEFWIVMNQPVSDGTKIKFSFDYRADKSSRIYISTHCNSFGDFIWDWTEPYIYPTEEWQTYTYEGVVTSLVSSDQKPLARIDFNLNEFADANTYYFDNAKFEVYLEDQCPKPTFTKTDNTVKIQSPFDATIYYTLDGSTPTTNSTVYTSPLAFEQDATIKAIAVVEGYETSPVATYEFAFTAAGPEPYAVLSDNNHILTFYYDENKAERNGMDVKPTTYTYEDDEIKDLITPDWYDYRDSIQTVVFDASFVNCTTLTSTAFWFFGCINLTTITGISNLKTDNVTDMGYMFIGCESLENLNVSGFNTSNVKTFYAMFANCSSLKELDITNFNTAKATHTNGMFYSCSELQTIFVGEGWSTANVTDGSDMFTDCNALVGWEGTRYDENRVDPAYAHVDGGTVNPGYFTDKAVMDSLRSRLSDKIMQLDMETNECELLLQSKDPEGVSTLWQDINAIRTAIEDVTIQTKRAKIKPEFDKCEDYINDIARKLAELRYMIENYNDTPEPEAPEPYAVLSNNNTVLTFYYDENRAEHNGMDVGPFSDYESRGWHNNCESITSVVFDASFTNYASLNSTAHWFNQCKNLTTITGISNLKTDNVTDMSMMFQDCSSLTNLDVSGFKTDNVTSMWNIFAGCSNLISLDVSNFNTSHVTKLFGMFQNCSNLTSLDVSNFNTSNATDMNFIFYRCSGLTSLDVSRFKTDNVESMGWMFADCINLTSLDVSGFKTEKVTNMNGMFAGCSQLTSLDVSGFKTDEVSRMGSMFEGCSSLISLDLSNFNTSKVEDMEYLFANCSSLASIQAGNANIMAAQYQEIGNPNLLVYVEADSLAPQGIQNVVVNGVAKEIVLTDATSGNNNFFCPEPFRAERISYTRNFQQRTEIGTSRGWESLTLPFTVQTITHATQGQISPFRNDASNKHFWLRRMTSNGLTYAQTIEPNVPYLIAMPNSTDYFDEFNLAGRVTFSAENVEIPRTEFGRYATNEIQLVPTFTRVAASDSIYALNVGKAQEGWVEGSVFIKNSREVRPFEVYSKHLRTNARPRFIPVNAKINIEDTGINDVEMDATEGDWYTIEGYKMQNEPKRKGIYIKKGKKVKK